MTKQVCYNYSCESVKARRYPAGFLLPESASPLFGTKKERAFRLSNPKFIILEERLFFPAKQIVHRNLEDVGERDKLNVGNETDLTLQLGKS